MNLFSPRDLLNSLCGRTFGIAIIDIRPSKEFEKGYILSTLCNFDYDMLINKSATKNDVRIKLLSNPKISSCIRFPNTMIVFLGGGFLICGLF
jgi:hypothetical protein